MAGANWILVADCWILGLTVFVVFVIERFRHILYDVGKILNTGGRFHVRDRKNLQSLNEVIVGSSSPAVAKLLARLKRDGRVVRLAPRLYSTNKTDSPDTAALSHCDGREGNITIIEANGKTYLVYERL